MRIDPLAKLINSAVLGRYPFECKLLGLKTFCPDSMSTNTHLMANLNSLCFIHDFISLDLINATL